MNYRLEGEINSRCWGQDWRLPRCIRLQASFSGTGNGRGSEFDLTGVQKFRSKNNDCVDCNEYRAAFV